MNQQRFSEEWIEAANCLATVAHQLSSAVHEANNLLQVIAGSAEMIQLNGTLPESVLRRTAVIGDHVQRVSSLLGAVRELSKFGPHQEGARTDIRAVLHAALDMRRHALNRAHVALSVEDAGPGPVMVLASWRPTMQIVLNLLLNAEQAVRGRTAPAITVRVVRTDGHVDFSVGDNGPGLAEQAADAATVRTLPDGAPLLGIGLQTARWLVEREAGKLEMQSSPEGTTAVLTLRAA